MLLFIAVITAGGEVRVEIEGVGGEVRENVRLHIGDPPPYDTPAFGRFRRRIPQKSREAMQALGYYRAEIEVEYEDLDEQPLLRVKVDAGEPLRISTLDVKVEGEASDDPAFRDLLEKLPLREEDVLHHGRYRALKREFENLALIRGYFDGRFIARCIEIDKEDYKADITVHYDSGRRYRTGPVRFPETTLRETLLQRLVPFAEGDFYRSENITRLNRNLVDSEYFTVVRVRPQPDKADENLRVPIDVHLEMEDPNRIGIGVGAATDVGPRMRFNWRRPWVNRHGHYLSAETEFSEFRQNITAQYTVPRDPPLEHKVQVVGGWQSEDILDTRSERLTAGLHRQRVLPGGWHSDVFMRWEQEAYTQSDFSGRTTLLLPGASISRTRGRGGSYPDRGDRLFGSLETAGRELGSDIWLARLRLRGRLMRSYRRHRGVARAEYGALNTEDFQRTPPSLRFFAGGDYSVRGFAYQTLAPRDAAGRLVGGRYLFTGSLEYSYEFIERWRAAAFVDAGNASADSEFSEGLEQGAGVGLRWLTPVGPLRIDIAVGVSDPDLPWRLHFSMGAEF